MRLAIKHRFKHPLTAILLLWLAVVTLAATRGKNQERIESKDAATVSQEEEAVNVQQGASVIRGRVVYADSRRPLRRAKVALYEAETGTWKGDVATDRRGLFVFEHLPAGRYFVIVDAPGIISPRSLVGWRASLVTQLMLGVIKDGYAEVTVDGKSSAETEVQARRGGAITGRVFAEDGEPVASVNVKLLRREGGRLIQVDSTWQVLHSEERALQTDSRGVYRIAGLPAGEYVVRVSEDDIGTDTLGDDDEAYSDGSLVIAYYPSATRLKDAQAVTVLEGSELAGIDVRMPDRETHRMRGRVSVGRNDEPAGYVEIKIDRQDERMFPRQLFDKSARTDMDGRWEVKGIPDGSYIVTVGSGFSARVGPPESGRYVDVAPKRLMVSVAGADVVGLDVHLSAGASVSGTVTIEGGVPLPTESLRVEVAPAAENKGLNNQARTSAGARPPAASRVENALTPEDESLVHSTFVRVGGEFKINSLPAGSYYLRLPAAAKGRFYVKSVTHKGVDLMRSSFRLDEGASVAGIRIVLATDLATVEGNVIVSAGETVSSGTIVVLAPADELTRRFTDGLLVARTDRFGRFRLRCPPGEYFIAAFTRRQAEKVSAAINEDYFRQDSSRLRRITLRPGERLKATGVAVMNN